MLFPRSAGRAAWSSLRTAVLRTLADSLALAVAMAA